MSHILVDAATDGDRLRDDLARSRRVALDCEAAGFHRYSDRLCLVQVTTESGTYVVDPLALDPSELLRQALEDPGVEVVMHGADFDLRLLRRDLGIRTRGLFDTQIAAQLLGEETLGLAALLESRLDVRLSKKYQRADWAERPLPEAMLEYAAEDTRHLMRLADELSRELAAAGRGEWVEEECLALEAAADGSDETDAPEDPVLRVKGARRLSARQVTALREALEWRDELARARDRALFRIVGEGPLVEAVAAGPRSVTDLANVKGFPARLARDGGVDLLRRLDRVRQMSDEELRPYPERSERGPGRPPPDVVALADRLKAVRNRRSKEIGLPRGTLLSNSVVLELARAAPTSAEELTAVAGMRGWKAELLGKELLDVIRGASRQGGRASGRASGR